MALADYIHLYRGNAALLTESLEVIQKTSAVILAAIEDTATENAEVATFLFAVTAEVAGSSPALDSKDVATYSNN